MREGERERRILRTHFRSSCRSASLSTIIALHRYAPFCCVTCSRFRFSFFSPILLRLFVSSFSIDYIYRLREYRGATPGATFRRKSESSVVYYYYYFVRAWILRASSSTFSLLAGTSRSSVVGTERGIHVRYTLLSYRI